MTLNVDAAEGFSHDHELFGFADWVNVCCGEHAGSPELTSATLVECRQRGLKVGAHPGFPDREGMGRRDPTDSETLNIWLLSARNQVLAWARDWEYVKPHGALYNILTRPDHWAYAACRAWVMGVQEATGLRFMLLAGTPLAAEVGAWREGFADRRYREDGTLVPRTEAGAVLKDMDDITAQLRRLEGVVDSVCVHGDGSDAMAICRHVAGFLR